MQQIQSQVFRFAAALVCTAALAWQSALGATVVNIPIDHLGLNSRDFPSAAQRLRAKAMGPTAPNGSQPILIGDGLTDNTAAIRKLLAQPNQTVVLPPGDYLTGSFSIPDNTILVLRPGVVIQDNGRLGANEKLITIKSQHVRVIAYGAAVTARRNNYTSGEQRHGIFIYGANDVSIEGLASIGQGGDGFYIGGPQGRPSTNVRIFQCVAKNNRRQGLSITNALGVLIEESQFTDSNGTAPQSGIDLEPNLPSDRISGISLINVSTEGNVGGGIHVVLDRLTPASEPVDVAILQHASARETPPILATGPVGVRATISCAGCTPP